MRVHPIFFLLTAGFVYRGTFVPRYNRGTFFLDWRYFFLFGPWTAVLSEIWTAGPRYFSGTFPVLSSPFQYFGVLLLKRHIQCIMAVSYCYGDHSTMSI